MGGHGALTLYLNHPELYKSASAFAPICNPVNAPWGKKAFSGPNGDDGYLAGGMEEGKKYDATELIKGKKGGNVNILVDSGTGDDLCVISDRLAMSKNAANRFGALCLSATRRDSSYRRTSRKPSSRLASRTPSRSTSGMATTTRTSSSSRSARITSSSMPSSLLLRRFSLICARNKLRKSTGHNGNSHLMQRLSVQNTMPLALQCCCSEPADSSAHIGICSRELYPMACDTTVVAADHQLLFSSSN